MTKDVERSVREPNDNWLQRWVDHNIGWHHDDFNPHLLNHWSALALPTSSLVFAPLCGKSRDLVWLAERGYQVRGVELSPLAVAAFFVEQQLRPLRTKRGAFEAWSSGPYEIYCGDIFDLPELDNSSVGAVYDRASLIALNPQQRICYAQLLMEHLPEQCQILLVAMDYDQREMTGPPYCVSQAEVNSLYADRYRVKMLHSLDLLRESERYRERGLTQLFEQVYHLTPLQD